MRKFLWLAVFAIVPWQRAYAKSAPDGFEFGIKFPTEKIGQLKINQTTVPQAWEILGEPMRMTPQDPFIICVYSRLTSQFKRVKGLIFTHQTKDMLSWGDMVILIFDQSGKLTSYAWNQKKLKTDEKGRYVKDSVGNYVIEENNVSEPHLDAGLSNMQMQETQGRAQVSAVAEQASQNAAAAQISASLAAQQAAQQAAQRAAFQAQQQQVMQQQQQMMQQVQQQFQQQQQQQFQQQMQQQIQQQSQSSYHH